MQIETIAIMNRLFFLITLLLASAAVKAQGTVDDYKRAYSIRHKYNNKVTGNVVAHLYYGNKKGRESADDRVCFIAGGMPVWDVGWGYDLYTRAKEMGLGQVLKLWDSPYLG